MAVLLLRFPLLVLQIILMQLDLYEIFSLATISKRTRNCVKSCLSHQGFTIYYMTNQSVTLARGSHKESTWSTQRLKIGFIEKSKQKLVYPYQFWKLLGQDAVPVRLALTLITYWEDKTDALPRMVQFLVDLFKRLQLRLYFSSGSPDSCRASIRLIKGLEVDVDYVSVSPKLRRRRVVHNELMRIVMEECHDSKSVVIMCENTELNLEIARPFNCDSISIDSAEWMTKEQLVEFFFNCKNVTLREKNYEDQDLAYIFEKWMAQTGSKIEFLCVTGRSNFYSRKSLTNIVGQLPGATPVQKALVQADAAGFSEVLKFGEGKCYRIEQDGGGRDALVHIMRDALHLAEKYEIGENVDEMEAANSESESEVSDDENPVVEELDDREEEAVESDQDVIQFGEHGEAMGIEDDNVGGEGDNGSDSGGVNGDDEEDSDE